MQNYKPGTLVPTIFDLIDESGMFFTPTSIFWRILDESEVELQPWTALLAIPTTSKLTLVIPAILTQITAPAVRAIRTVEVEVVTALGTFQLSSSVMIQGTTALVFGVNTFQTYSQSLLLSEDFTAESLSGWNAFDRESREKGLIEAYRRILSLPLRLEYDSGQSSLAQDASFLRDFNSRSLRNMTPAQIAALYAPMLTALRLSQVMECDEILNRDPQSDARNRGVTSITAGESSTTFRSSVGLDLSISMRALKPLGRWLNFNARIARA